ncbi:hypothetical protein FOA43_003676 [Brettanomyces nanus]|uniref:Uncharacterized protein n=1 Tax=Eeniella nana TaxID=13502 RepID=A0A875RQ99_EENNA|nr:uncharacterized protein FOA43_003676 [Brettanomyces nanus]QPG76290.1 hypothetical protein FOA43_003676 [Brettanomyces nanus]
MIFTTVLMFLCYTILRINIYVPSGPFGIIFGLVYPYYKFTPTLYTFELDFRGIGKSSNDADDQLVHANESHKLVFTNNFVTTILVAQLFLSEGLISSPIVCLTGYLISSLLFNGVLPLLHSKFVFLTTLYGRLMKKFGHSTGYHAIPNIVSTVPSVGIQSHSRSISPEDVDNTTEEHDDNDQDTDMPARSLGTQLLDTFR